MKEITEMNIYEKMSAIASEIPTVAKNLTVNVNTKSSYKAVSERDVLDAVKPLEKKYRVFSIITDREIVSEDTLTRTTVYKDQTTTTNSLFLRIKAKGVFVNLDNPQETIETTSYGDGIDTGDKAPGKAMTYADKYVYMKAYKISTGDDPDQEASPENGYTHKAKPEQLQIITDYFSQERLEKMMKGYGISKLSDLTLEQASKACEVAKAGK